MTKAKPWTAYDPALPVDRPDVSETERLTDAATYQWWGETMGRLSGLQVMSGWLDFAGFINAVSGLGRALDWISKRLGVALAGVWYVARGTYELCLVDQGSKQEAALTLTRRELMQQPLVAARILEATGLAAPVHGCLEWYDVCVIVQRAAMYFDQQAAFASAAPTHGRV